MANIYAIFIKRQKSHEDLIYFVEDDYIHKKNAINWNDYFLWKTCFTQLKREIFICPTDYPYLYTKESTTKIYLGEKYHWRKVNEHFVLLWLVKKWLEKNWDNLIKCVQKEHYPFEKPLHDIYEKEIMYFTYSIIKLFIVQILILFLDYLPKCRLEKTLGWK